LAQLPIGILAQQLLSHIPITLAKLLLTNAIALIPEQILIENQQTNDFISFRYRLPTERLDPKQLDLPGYLLDIPADQLPQLVWVELV